MKLWTVTAGLAAAVLIACYAFYLKLERSLTGNLGKRRTNPRAGKPLKGEQIVLCSFFTPVGELAASCSPFTAKIEAFLRMRGISYKALARGFDLSPNGRLPWIEHGEDQISDSRFIVRYLLATYPELQRYEPSAPEERARATVIQRLCEQHIYFTNLYHSVVPNKAKARAPGLFRNFPFPMPYLLALAWRNGRETQLRFEGLLTNSEDDINELIEEDFAALSALLDKNAYFFGDIPSVTDACVFGFLEGQVYGGSDSYPSTCIKKHRNLIDFVNRIRAEYFADKLAKLGQNQGKAQ